MAKIEKLTPNEMLFVQTCLMNGCSLDIALSLIGKQTPNRSEASNNANFVSNSTDFTKGEVKAPVTTKGSKKSGTNKVSSKKSPAKAEPQPLKVGDFFKVGTSKKLVAVGKVSKIENGAVYGDNPSNCYAIDKAIKINEKTFEKLKGKLAKGKKSKKDKLSPLDYKVIYCQNLLKLGKISGADYVKAQNVAEFASELYHKYKDEIKLSNADALKLSSGKTEDNAKANA